MAVRSDVQQGHAGAEHEEGVGEGEEVAGGAPVPPDGALQEGHEHERQAECGTGEVGEAEGQQVVEGRSVEMPLSHHAPDHQGVACHPCHRQHRQRRRLRHRHRRTTRRLPADVKVLDDDVVKARMLLRVRGVGGVVREVAGDEGGQGDVVVGGVAEGRVGSERGERVLPRVQQVLENGRQPGRG